MAGRAHRRGAVRQQIPEFLTLEATERPDPPTVGS